MEVWAARVPLKARPDRQRLLSQENSSQTALRFSARSQLERLAAALAAQLAKAAAQLAAPPPQQPFHHEVASRFLLSRWVSLCLARNHNSMHKQTPVEHASPTPQDRRGDRSGSSSRCARYYLDTWRSLLPTRYQGNRVSIHLK